MQGVGFRPFVFSHASSRALNGRVLNNASGVLIDLEGEAADIDRFVLELVSNPPPLSSIESIERVENLTPLDYPDFQILESDPSGRRTVPISSDVGTCDDCVRELFDQNNRRFQYPFINCTNCGPRFTITERVPYDRANTTMDYFKMCSACRAEYENPSDRRFHAEPTACEVCGPRLRLLDDQGAEVKSDPLTTAIDLLARKKILAIKGIGGFHLACDALSREAVVQLRARKFREDKPFALMARSVDVIRRYCRISAQEIGWLESPARPIVLLERKRGNPIPRAVAPGLNTLGFMLPYTPLHHLLLASSERPLVMTSGNISDEPICFLDDDAGKRLHKLADYFLVNDRPIHVRTDDSVVRSNLGRPMVLRRSRGYAPAPLHTSFEFERSILACGAELKNTFCLARGRSAFVSHHIGDLENLETLRSFTEGIDHYKQLFDIAPDVIAYDLHPEYLSTKFALALDEPTTKIGVQHHHAHVASCMADNEIDGEVIGVAFDGLGYGLDGKLWGGEFFVADYCHAERVAHLVNVPLPGGAKAIREPWRLAAVYLQRTFGAGFLELDLPFTRQLDRARWSTVRSMIDAGVNSPETSSMGRLFDAVAGLLTLRSSVNYEGQAAIEMESIADKVATDSYEFEIEGEEISAEGVIRRAVADVLDEVPGGQIAARFHVSVARMIFNVAQRIRENSGLNRVAVSGGVFQNMFLLQQTTKILEQSGFEVFTHSRVPANDGGISLGQAAIANARIQSGRSN